jgi:hypothetical protein
MKFFHISLFCILFLFLTASPSSAEDWRDKMELIIYSPRYFGPNAFPMPEMRNGDVGRRIEAELRGEYHYYKGDKTKDIYARVLVPFVKGRAGVEVSLIVREKYKMLPETKDERFAAETEWPTGCTGDLIFTSFFQVLRSEKWADIVLSGTIKTASGNRLADARFTDAAAYWFDLNIARNLWKSTDGLASLRMQILGGFYCWMTNDRVYRQNDAIAYGGGLTGTYKNFILASNISGIRGYKNNGDRPIHWQNKLSYELKKNILTFRYTHGMKDRLYESYSLGYTRCF